MNQRTTVSPEIIRAQAGRKHFFFRVIDYAFSRVKYFFLKRKWAHHADERVLHWDWKKINFNRIAVVNILLNKFKTPTYLEIGCASNSLFDSVPVQGKVGVDPSSGGNVRATSDEFFEKNKEQFDVIFIDGLHTYEQVRKDVMNAIKVINEGGWIALHDMLPRDWLEHHVPLVSIGAWTGDVWKVAFELIQTEGVEFKILKIDHGVGVIKVINSDTAILKDLSKDLMHQEFSYYYDNLNKLPLLDWDDALPWLQS
jgi:hypothetical protein